MEYCFFQARDGFLQIPKQGRVYEEFKLYHLNCKFGTIRELCQDLLEYAKYYTNIVFKRNSDTDLKKLYEDIIDLRMEVSYPFLLKIHHDCIEGLITSDELSRGKNSAEIFLGNI